VNDNRHCYNTTVFALNDEAGGMKEKLARGYEIREGLFQNPI
jgi:hypothetical protein